MSDEEDQDAEDDAQRGDPFDDLAADVEDREGDPFADLEADADEDQESQPAQTDDQPTDSPDPQWSEDRATADQGVDDQATDDQSVEGLEEDPFVNQFDSRGPDAAGSEVAESDDSTQNPTADVTSQPGQPNVESEPAEEDVDPTDSSQMTWGVGRDKTTDTEAEPLVDGVQREGDPFDQMGGAFEDMEVGGLDPDRVWQDLASAESRGSVGDATERTYADVDKHAYCEQCEYFSGPPEINCTHEGTEIVEFLDMATVRVVDCPIVAEREELEQDDSVALTEDSSGLDESTE
jgi:hypothetical protein